MEGNQTSAVMVSVLMITYKHEAFIKQAVECILAQETGFEYELIIADDCSPDSTSAVIAALTSSHPAARRIKYFRHSPNIGAAANVVFAFNHCKGKYIALCEGDDYWTDSLKLQKQVDFLEANRDYGLVHTNNKIFLEKDQTFSELSRIINDDENLFEYLIFKNNPICTLTVCLRAEMMLRYLSLIDVQKDAYLVSDYPIWIWFSMNSKIKLINEVTGVYRILEESASQSADPKKKILFIENAKKQALFFLDEHRKAEYELAFYKKYSFLYARMGEAEKKKFITRLFWNTKNYLHYLRFNLLKVFNSESAAIKLIDKIQLLTETKMRG